MFKKFAAYLTICGQTLYNEATAFSLEIIILISQRHPNVFHDIPPVNTLARMQC
jgi:hypothetical protein